MSITFPFFALVLCGYLATRLSLLPMSAIAGLNSFVLFFALPSMLYRFGAQTPMEQLLSPSVALLYTLSGLVVVAGTIFATLKRWGWNDAAFGALVTAFPNSGFMGLPLLVAILGQESAAVVIITIAVDMLVLSSLCIALSRLGLGGGQGAGSALRALRRALHGVLVNPLPWAILLGGCASAWQWRFPVPLEQTLEMLASSASPVALFTIGAVLARSQMNQDEHLDWQHYVPLALVKLVVHPMLVWIGAQGAALLGAPLPEQAVIALILVAALPSASNVSLLAERFDAHGGRIARIILVSTALAFLSFSGVGALLGV